MPDSTTRYTRLDAGLAFETPEKFDSISYWLVKPWAYRLLLGFTALSVALNVTWLSGFGVTKSQSSPQSTQLAYSPAEVALDYKTVTFHSGFGANLPIYDLSPSPEVDDAWQDLYRYAGIKVPKEQAARMANKTWPILGDEENYLIAFDVFHELHCLNIIRKALHPEYYNETFTQSSIRHCISCIRQSLMCSADISPIVWQWSQISHAATERANVVHSCRDFDKLHSWVKENHLDMNSLNLTVYIKEDVVPESF